MQFGVSPRKQQALLKRMDTLNIREADLEERFIKSSGPGGQNVNKVETGVYLKHVPTGIEVKMTQERSQALNRFLARRVLCDKVEAYLRGEIEREQSRIAKLRRQKRKRAKRAKEKVLRLKRMVAEKKALRQEPIEE